MSDLEDKLAAIQSVVSGQDIVGEIAKMKEENIEIKKKMEEQRRLEIEKLAEQMLAEAEEIEGVCFIRKSLDFSPAEIKTLVFQLRNRRQEKLCVAIGGNFENKPSLTVLLSDDLVKKGYNATNMVRSAAKEIQGGGGGQPFFAQAGGKNIEGLQKALSLISL